MSGTFIVREFFYKDNYFFLFQIIERKTLSVGERTFTGDKDGTSGLKGRLAVKSKIFYILIPDDNNIQKSFVQLNDQLIRRIELKSYGYVLKKLFELSGIVFYPFVKTIIMK